MYKNKLQKGKSQMNKNLKKLLAFAVSMAAAITTMAGIPVSAEESQAPLEVTEKSAAKSSTGTTYTGSAITPDIMLYDDDVQLVKGVDYDLSYENNINVGTATIIVTFKGNYSGERRVTFNITAKPLTQDDVIISLIDEQIFIGEPITPKPTVTFGDKTLVEGTDYDLTYSDNTNAGTAKVEVTFKGNYEGTAGTTFEIVSKSLVQDDLTIADIADKTFTGTEIKPEPEIKYGDVTLVKGVDYELSYENNINVGEANITITLKNNYSGTATKKFTIVPDALDQSKVTFAVIEEQSYTGSEIKPEPIITYGDKTLVKDIDYTISYENNINVGTGNVNVTFIGNYSGMAGTTFEITPKIANEDNITISVIPDQVYTGQEITPEPIITDTSR